MHILNSGNNTQIFLKDIENYAGALRASMGAQAAFEAHAKAHEAVLNIAEGKDGNMVALSEDTGRDKNHELFRSVKVDNQRSTRHSSYPEYRRKVRTHLLSS